MFCIALQKYHLLAITFLLSKHGKNSEKTGTISIKSRPNDYFKKQSIKKRL